MGSEIFRACMIVYFDIEQLLGAKECVHWYLITNVHLLVFMLPDFEAEIFRILVNTLGTSSDSL
jgi:hypothetical protein